MNHLFHCPAISIENAFQVKEALFIDVRSPSEFKKDHLPKAKNIALFEDLHRAVVGTIYAQQGSMKAQEEGVKIVQERIGWIVKEYKKATKSILGEYQQNFEEILRHFLKKKISNQLRTYTPMDVVNSKKQPVFIYCWRGGMRSLALTLFFRGLGENVYQIQGGYKSFRSFVFHFLKQAKFHPFVVLDGLTGVGKTEVLNEIESYHPGLTLDLENLAGHRSSILGSLGLKPKTQKAFESHLAFQIPKLKGARTFIEAESAKIGSIHIPRNLFQNILKGDYILLENPIQQRIQQLLKNYICSETVPFLEDKMPFFQKQLPKKITSELERSLHQSDFEKFTYLLLVHYYDPKYRYSLKQRKISLLIKNQSPESAVQKILETFPI